MQRVREDFGDFFEIVSVEDLVGVTGLNTVIADCSTTLRQKLPGLTSGDGEMMVAKRCGLHVSKPLRLWDIGFILFNFVNKLFNAGVHTVVIALDSAVPFAARALTRIARVAKTSSRIANMEDRVNEVQRRVDELYRALQADKLSEDMLDLTIDSDCCELIAFDGTKSVFQQLVLLTTVAVARHEGVRNHRLFVLGIQRQLHGSAQEIICRNNWGYLNDAGDRLHVAEVHPWCEKTGLLATHCEMNETDGSYTVTPEVLRALVFQEAQYFSVLLERRSINLHVLGVDTSLEKDFFAPALFGPGNFAALNDIDSASSCFFTGGDVDCFASAVLQTVVGQWPSDLMLSTTTMHTYSKTGGYFEVVHDLKQLAPNVVPYMTGFVAGCDYQVRIQHRQMLFFLISHQVGLSGLGHRSVLKHDLLKRMRYDNDTLLYNESPLFELRCYDYTTVLCTSVVVHAGCFKRWITDVVHGSRMSAKQKEEALCENRVTTTRLRMQWYLGYLLNGHTTLWHHTTAFPLCKATVCGSRTWVLPTNEDGALLQQVWKEVETTMHPLVTREDPLQRHAIPMQLHLLNLPLGRRLFGA